MAFRRATMALLVLLLSAVTPFAYAQPAAPSVALDEARALAKVVIAASKSGHHHEPTEGAVHVARLQALGETAKSELRAATERRDIDTFSGAAAAYALFRIDPASADKSTAVLLALMNKGMFSSNMTAHHLILSMGSAAVPELTRHLNDSMVIQILGAMGPNASGAVPSLLQVLGSGNVEVAATLASIGTSDAISQAKPVLSRALDNPNSPYAKTALIGISKLGIGAADTLPVVRKALQAVDADTRVHAAIAIADIGQPAEASKALGRLVSDKSLHDPHMALLKLETMGAQARPALPDLIRFVGDSADTRVRERARAANVLQKIAPTDKNVINVLKNSNLQINQ